MERLESLRWLKGGLSALTAAVVGVIANLTVWFALHVLFAQVGERQYGPLRLYWPDTGTFVWQAAVLAILSAALIFQFKWNVIKTLAAAGIGGMLLGQIS
jgi:chromate transporter